jgi:hypothetical protein
MNSYLCFSVSEEIKHVSFKVYNTFKIIYITNLRILV